MRGWMLAAGAALTLSACGDKEAANAQAENVNVTATDDAFMANDTTAIDAATSMDANMAADASMAMNDMNLPDNEIGNEADAPTNNAD